jgi:hypothetical protein
MPPSCEGLMGYETSQEGPYLLRCTLKYELLTLPNADLIVRDRLRRLEFRLGGKVQL